MPRVRKLKTGRKISCFEKKYGIPPEAKRKNKLKKK